MTVRVPQGYPVGTTLSVYVDRVGDVQPQGTPVSTCVVAADSTATITGITPVIPYQVGAVIGGKWRSFLVEMALPVATDLNAVATELAAHEADSTDVHGVVGTVAGDAEVSAAIATAISPLATTAAMTAGDAAAVPKSLVDAKGDIIGASANDTPARVAVGSDGQVLTADAASAAGVKWAAAAAGGGGAAPVFLLRRVGAGQIAGGFNFLTPQGFSSTDPQPIDTNAERPFVFAIRAADLAVSGKTTMMRTRLTVRTNGTAPGVDFKARVYTAVFSGSGTIYAVTGGTEVDSSPTITTPALNTLSTSQSAGVALPADGEYVWYLWTSGGPAASRQLVEVEIQAYWV